MMNSEYPTARKTGLVVQEMPGEVLVYDLDSNKAHCLNQTAASVWRSCDGKTAISDIAGIIAADSGSDVSEDLVWLAIDQLSENNLLEKQFKAKLGGQSRRDVIKKIGLASMVAIPVIASLAAPRSAMAAVSCICGNNNDCLILGPPCGATCNTTAGVCQ